MTENLFHAGLLALFVALLATAFGPFVASRAPGDALPPATQAAEPPPTVLIARAASSGLSGAPSIERR